MARRIGLCARNATAEQRPADDARKTSPTFDDAQRALPEDGGDMFKRRIECPFLRRCAFAATTTIHVVNHLSIEHRLPALNTATRSRVCGHHTDIATITQRVAIPHPQNLSGHARMHGFMFRVYHGANSYARCALFVRVCPAKAKTTVSVAWLERECMPKFAARLDYCMASMEADMPATPESATPMMFHRRSDNFDFFANVWDPMGEDRDSKGNRGVTIRGFVSEISVRVVTRKPRPSQKHVLTVTPVPPQHRHQQRQNQHRHRPRPVVPLLTIPEIIPFVSDDDEFLNTPNTIDTDSPSIVSPRAERPLFMPSSKFEDQMMCIHADVRAGDAETDTGNARSTPIIHTSSAFVTTPTSPKRNVDTDEFWRKCNIPP